MDYAKYISTPKNTLATSPLTTIIRVTKGALKAGWIYFPVGPAGKLYCQIFHGDYQLAPANRGEAYHIDNGFVKIRFGSRIDAMPYELSIVTWNTSTQYDHALTVGIALDADDKESKKTRTVQNEIFIDQLIRDATSR